MKPPTYVRGFLLSIYINLNPGSSSSSRDLLEKVLWILAFFLVLTLSSIFLLDDQFLSSFECKFSQINCLKNFVTFPGQERKIPIFKELYN